MRIELIAFSVAWFAVMFLLGRLARNRQTERLRDLLKETRALARGFQATAASMRPPSGAVALRAELRPAAAEFGRTDLSRSSDPQTMIQTVVRMVESTMRGYDSGSAAIDWHDEQAHLKLVGSECEPKHVLVNRHLHTVFPTGELSKARRQAK